MWRARTRLIQDVGVPIQRDAGFPGGVTLTNTGSCALTLRTAQHVSWLSTATTAIRSRSEDGQFKRQKVSQTWRIIGHRSFSHTIESKSWWKGSSKPAESQPPVSSFDARPLDIPEETRAETEQLPTRRVHILGVGSIGTFVAHSLQCLPNPPPITLLLHKPELYRQFTRNGRLIRLINPQTDINDEQYGYDVDVLDVDEETDLKIWKHVPNLDKSEGGRGRPTNPLQEGEMLESGEVYIYTLIVTVKGPATVQALRSVKHRVDAETTICFLQNGMGQIDELNRQVFTDPKTRPTYMLGIISHGAHMSGSFAVVHAGFGTTAVGIYRDTDKYPLPSRSSNFNPNQLSDEERKRFYPDDTELYSNLSSRYLLRTLTRSPVLACTPFPYVDLFQLQLDKLVMNSIVNPVTALLNIPNGEMLGNTPIDRTMRLLLAETSYVIRRLPELEGVPGVAMRYSPERLENLCKGIAARTAQNSSSMREDVRNVRRTEIEYINGYIVRRGEEQGVKCVLNYLVMKLVEAKIFAKLGEGAPNVQPYGTSLVEESDSDPAAGPDRPVILEDKGTQLRGKSY